MRRNVILTVVAIALLSFASHVVAHHAFSAEFDANKPVKLRGSVTKMDWINPHAWMHISVRNPDGSVVNWMIELGPPNALIKRGWSRNSVPVGMEVIVDGYQSKDGALRANGRDVTLPDGKKMFAGSQGTGAPGDEK